MRHRKWASIIIIVLVFSFIAVIPILTQQSIFKNFCPIASAQDNPCLMQEVTISAQDVKILEVQGTSNAQARQLLQLQATKEAQDSQITQLLATNFASNNVVQVITVAVVITATPFITATPSPEPQLEIVGIVSPGDLDSEGVVIRNNGDIIDINGWSLSDSNGNVYTFSERLLFSNGSITLFTRTGQDTAIVAFWNRNAAIFGEPKDVITLRDAEDRIQSEYEVPSD
jgi:hypothetical protein